MATRCVAPRRPSACHPRVSAPPRAPPPLDITPPPLTTYRATRGRQALRVILTLTLTLPLPLTLTLTLTLPLTLPLSLAPEQVLGRTLYRSMTAITLLLTFVVTPITIQP